MTWPPRRNRLWLPPLPPSSEDAEPLQLSLDDELAESEMSFGEWVISLPTRLEDAA